MTLGWIFTTSRPWRGLDFCVYIKPFPCLQESSVPRPSRSGWCPYPSIFFRPASPPPPSASTCCTPRAARGSSSSTCAPRRDDRREEENARGTSSPRASTYVHAGRAQGAEREATNAIDIAEFVPLDKVERIYIEKVYYLGPDKGGERAYRLLAPRCRKPGAPRWPSTRRGASSTWCCCGRWARAS